MPQWEMWHGKFGGATELGQATCKPNSRPLVTSYLPQFQKRRCPHSSGVLHRSESFMWVGIHIWQLLRFPLPCSPSSNKQLTLWQFKVRFGFRVTMCVQINTFDTKIRGAMWKTSCFLWWFCYQWNWAAAGPSSVFLDNLDAQQLLQNPRGCLCFCMCLSVERSLTCWRLTQEHVLPLDDQNMSISPRCFETNPLWGVSETYLYLSLRWRALNRQFISLSHFRLCFLVDKWHLLVKPSGWSPLPATTVLLGCTPNIHHNKLYRPVCLTLFASDFRVSKRLQRWVATALSLYLLPGFQTGDRDFIERRSPSSILQCTHAMQQHNNWCVSDKMPTRPCVDPLSSMGSRWVTAPEMSSGNYKYEAAPPFTFWQMMYTAHSKWFIKYFWILRGVVTL